MEMESEEHWFVGVDVGGTSIKLGFIKSTGQIVSEHQIETCNELGPKDAIRRICNEMKRVFESNGDHIKAVGLGSPGPLDTRKGIILDPFNLPGWRQFPIRSELAKTLNRPVTYANDANAAAFGEFWLGKGRNCDSLLLLTLGTGVGAGIIVNGGLISGANDQAAECGHIVVDYSENGRKCSCGQRGHLEAYASASAVAAIAKCLAEEYPDSDLGRLLKTGGDLTAQDVYHCAERQDPTSLEIVDQTARYLARGIADIAHFVDPELILLGGAMNFGGESSPVGKRFLSLIEEHVRTAVLKRTGDNLNIQFASLGGSAGWIGAAGLAKRDYDRNL